MTFINKLASIILISSILVGLTNCSPILVAIYGVKNPKMVDEKRIEHYSEKFNIPSTDNFELDTLYNSFINSIDTVKYKQQQKNHWQPLQALYYDKSGQLQSFHINCYAGGFPNLKWNRDSILSTFPPKQQAPIDSILPFDTLEHYLKTLSKSNKIIKENYDYIVVVFWDIFMYRQSKRLIEFIQENCKLAVNKKVKIIYVNNDNCFLNAEIE
jgi:hypothetical protein